MPTKTHNLVIGDENKDAKNMALQKSLESIQQKLAALGFQLIEQSWINPIANIWSVRICDHDCPLLFTIGTDISKKAALQNALEKFFERIATHQFWANYYLGDEIANSKFVHYKQEQWFEIQNNATWPEGVLNEDLRDFYDPDEDLEMGKLIDINSGNRKRGMCCLPYLCQKTREEVFFPVNIIENLYVDNGTAVSETPEKAKLHALSEIVENYVKFKIISEGISLPEVPQSVLNRYNRLSNVINEIKEAGYSVLLKDASLGGKYPVMAVTLLNPQNQGVCASFGAHPEFEFALERALTRLFEGRDLDDLQHFPEAGFDMDEIASPQNLERHYIDSSGIVSWQFLHSQPHYEFIDWGTSQNQAGDQIPGSNSQDLFEDMCNLIHAEGNDIYISEHQELGVYCCRILVPGMSEIYPSVKLAWENNNAGIDIRNALLKQNKTAAECEALIEKIETLNFEDQYLVASLIGLPADTDSIFTDLSLAELITLLALKIQDNERIQSGCEWLLHYQQINPRRLKTYQCIDNLLQLEGMVNYADALVKLYGKSILNDTLALIDGEDVFPLHNDWKMHGLLLQAYQKVIQY